MENDEVYTIQVERYLLVKINDYGAGAANDDGDDDFGRITSIGQELFWYVTCINSFHPQSKQYYYPHFIDEVTMRCPKLHS